VQVSEFNVWAIIPWDSTVWDRWFEQFQQFDIPLLQMAPRCEVYAMRSSTSLAMHCDAQILVWCLMWDLVSYLFSWFLLDVMWNPLCDVLVVMICHGVFWDPFVVCWWDTHVVVLYVCIEIPFMPCWWDDHHAWVCVILIGVLLTKSTCSGTSLGATPAWGHFPCMIATSPLMHIIIIDNT